MAVRFIIVALCASALFYAANYKSFVAAEPQSPNVFVVRQARMDSEVTNTQLDLVSARKSRGADYWDNDDYDVRLGEASGGVVGRIFRQPRAPMEQPWFWTITAREQPPSVYNRGYAVSREQAMRYFKARYIGPSN